MSWGIVAGSVIGGGLSLLGSSKAASAQKDAAGQSADVQRYMFDQSQAMQAPWQQTGASALAQLAGLYGLTPINYMGQGASAGAGAPAGPQSGLPSGVPYTGAFGGMTPELDPAVWGGGAASGGSLSPIPGSQYTLGLTPHDVAGSNQGVSGGTTYTPQAQGGFAGAVPGQDAAMANFYTSPGYQFRLNEGLNALAGMASAQGLRGSGATSQDIMRYSQGLASDEYNQYTNRLAALAGVGQTSAGQMGNQALMAGQGIGQAYTNAGNARASGIIGVTNSLGNSINNAAWMYGMYGGGGAPNPNTYIVGPGGGTYTDSDIRLKDNVEKVGPGRYRWKWNDIARELGISDQPTEGEIAQEVLRSEPERVRVGPHGYLQIRVA